MNHISNDMPWKTINSTLGAEQIFGPVTEPLPVPENDPFPPSENPGLEEEAPEEQNYTDEEDDDQLNTPASDQMIERAGVQAESVMAHHDDFEKFAFHTLWR